jgi:hypothetical protein
LEFLRAPQFGGSSEEKKKGIDRWAEGRKAKNDARIEEFQERLKKFRPYIDNLNECF